MIWLRIGCVRHSIWQATTQIKHVDVNPFGVNVFLDQEVELVKREETIKLAQAAGFDWLRQEFPWEEIEIHGKGDFEDRRHEPHRSAWEKFDTIVDLAEQHDMQLIVRLSNPPEWTRALTITVGSFAPPDNLQDYADFVARSGQSVQGTHPLLSTVERTQYQPGSGQHPDQPGALHGAA